MDVLTGKQTDADMIWPHALHRSRATPYSIMNAYPRAASVESEDRSHDLRIMRLTRYQLRYFRQNIMNAYLTRSKFKRRGEMRRWAGRLGTCIHAYNIYICICMYIYIYICVYSSCIYIYIERERYRERDIEI